MDASAEDSQARGLREPSAEAIPAHLIGALEAEVTEQGEWSARLEARLEEVERRLSDPGAAGPDSGATAEIVPPAHGGPRIG
jgi:hypothetical protein